MNWLIQAIHTTTSPIDQVKISLLVIFWANIRNTNLNCRS